MYSRVYNVSDVQLQHIYTISDGYESTRWPLLLEKKIYQDWMIYDRGKESSFSTTAGDWWHEATDGEIWLPEDWSQLRFTDCSENTSSESDPERLASAAGSAGCRGHVQASVLLLVSHVPQAPIQASSWLSVCQASSSVDRPEPLGGTGFDCGSLWGREHINCANRAAAISWKILSKRHHSGRLNSFNAIVSGGSGREELPYESLVVFQEIKNTKWCAHIWLQTWRLTNKTFNKTSKL